MNSGIFPNLLWKKLEIPKILFSVSFYVQLRELRIAITCVIEPSLYSFLLMFVSSFSLTSLVCRHSDLTLMYILRWQKSPRLFSLRIFFQHSQLLQLASFSLLYTLITQGLGNQIPSFFVFFFWHNSPQWVTASSFMGFIDHTQRRTTFGRTPLDEWSARRRDLYLITHNTHNRQTSMPPMRFEPTISAGQRLQTYPLDRASTRTGFRCLSTQPVKWPCLFLWETVSIVLYLLHQMYWCSQRHNPLSMPLRKTS